MALLPLKNAVLGEPFHVEKLLPMTYIMEPVESFSCTLGRITGDSNVNNEVADAAAGPRFRTNILELVSPKSTDVPRPFPMEVKKRTELSDVHKVTELLVLAE
jgi:hypothetical protein